MSDSEQDTSIKIPDPNTVAVFTGYDKFLSDLKTRIQTAQICAGLAVNRELVLLYWNIGREIIARQAEQGWGAKVIDRLAHDLKAAFTEMSGFSPRNLKYMRLLAETYGEEEFVQQAVAQIPWGHNVRILDKIKDRAEAEFYIRQTVENGWSRNVLELQIDSGLYNRQGKAVTNFSNTLPAPQSDLARDVLKDPYVFDFLTLGADAHERDVERGLIENIRKFLLELGAGFSFAGSQYHLEVGGQDYYLDLLFYHWRLRAFIVIDLKITEFKPEYAGKMNFYLSAVDEQLKHATDAPSIGLILCRTPGGIIAEYALRDLNKPIGVSGFQITEALPEDLQGSLPTVEELEAQIGKFNVDIDEEVEKKK